MKLVGKSYVIEVVSQDKLEEFAKSVKDYTKISDIVGLYGDLGAGKTAFVKAFCKIFGFYNVTSPTFSILNEYDLKDFKIIHGDFYRVEYVKDFVNYIKENRYNTITFIEWPKDIECTKKLHITSIDKDRRVFKLCI